MSSERKAPANLGDLNHCTADRYKWKERGEGCWCTQRRVGGAASQPSPRCLVDRSRCPPTCPDCILHTFPQRLEDGCERVHKRGCAVVDKEIAVPSISSRPPPLLCAQCPKHHGDIETDISLLDERGISVTQAPKVNVV